MTSEEFRNNHPDMTLKVDRSSESGRKWYGEARMADTGKFVAGFNSREDLASALDQLHQDCAKRSTPMIDASALRLRNKPLLPDSIRRPGLINYGLSMEVGDDNKDHDD